MDLSELFNKIFDEDDISSESALFDFQEATEVLNRARMGEIDTGKISKLFIPLAKVASEQRVCGNEFVPAGDRQRCAV